MSAYLVQAAYTGEAWGTQVKSPKSAMDRIRPAIEKLGGRIESMYYAFGDHDIIATVDFPDNASAAAFSMAAAAGGAVRSVKTTPLMALEEGVEAMKKAGGSGYRPPGS